MNTNTTGFYGDNSVTEAYKMAANDKEAKIIFAERVKKVEGLIKDGGWYSEFKMILGYYLPNHPSIQLMLDAVSEPRTNGRAIWAGMPKYMINREQELNEVEIYASLRAILAHEAQHIRSSNFKEYTKYIEHIVKYFGELDEKYKNPGYKGVLQHIAISFGNGIEDGRIERIIVNNRPGLTKYFRYFRLEWWKAQPVEKPNDNLSTFLWSIVTLATTGMYPLGFDQHYAGTEVEKELKRIEAEIILATNTYSAEECLKACYEIIQGSKELLCKWLDEIPVNTLNNMPQEINHEYSTSEEDEFNEQAPQQSSIFDNAPQPQQQQNENKNEEKNEGSQSGSGQQGEKDESENKEEGQAGGSNGEKSEEDKQSEGQAGGSDGEKSEEDKQSEGQAGGSNGEKSEEQAGSEEKAQKGNDGSDKPGDKKGDSGRSDSSEEGDKKSEQGKDASEGEQGKSGKDQKAQDAKSPIQNMEDHLSAVESYGEGGEVEAPKDGERLDEVNKMISDILNDVQKDFEQSKQNINNESNRSAEQSRANAATLTKEELREIMSKSGFGYQDIDVREGSGARLLLPQEIQYRAKRFAKEVKSLFDNKSTPTKRNQVAGRIDPLKLYKVGMKDNTIMKKNGRKSIGDYVAYFIKDESASMRTGKRTSAGIALSIAEEALKPLIPLKITSYTTSDHGVTHKLIKDFDDTSKRSFSYTDLVNNPTGRGNADGVAIRTAVAELSKHRNKDKLLFVFSDGVPSAYGKESVGLADVKAAVTEARRKGIRVFCIMFGTESERTSLQANFEFMYGSDFISVDPNEIEKVLKNRLMKTLIK